MGKTLLYFLIPSQYTKTMPTYEYECRSCGHNFEAFQSMSDAPLSNCPECGRELRRLINGGSGIIFKGSGFYINDKNKGNDKKPPSKPSDGGSSKPDSKPGEATGSSACASCPVSAASGGSCPASDKAAG